MGIIGRQIHGTEMGFGPSVLFGFTWGDLEELGGELANKGFDPF